MVKLKKNVLIEAHKKNWTKQHSELFYWTSNKQFKRKMDLPLEKVSKITSASLTITMVISCQPSRKGLKSMHSCSKFVITKSWNLFKVKIPGFQSEVYQMLSQI